MPDSSLAVCILLPEIIFQASVRLGVTRLFATYHQSAILSSLWSRALWAHTRVAARRLNMN